MTYFESAEGLRISRARALKELENHGIFAAADFSLFDTELPAGADGLYSAAAVLQWLGY